MQLKDATSVIGRVGLLIPLILIFLTAVDSAFACPGHKTKAAYRTRAINTRTVAYMPTTVISYRAPMSYRRCGADLYDTRGARYVATRGNGTRYVAIRGSGARYVAVLDDDDLYKPKLRRYGAVYDVDYGEAPRRYRTVAVRRPVYIETGTRYIPVRRVEPRIRYMSVRDIDFDDDDEPRYVAVRRQDPAVRYVAVRNTMPRTRYVTVNNINSACTRAVALRRCLDEVETTSVKHVVLRNDAYSTRTKHVVLRDGLDEDDVAYFDRYDDDDDEYVAVATETPKYVMYKNATYSNGNGRNDIAANECVAVRTCRPDVVSARTIAYEVSDDDDLDDRVFLRDDRVTYVAVNDMEDACLSGRVVGTSPAVTREVEYEPVEYVDDEDYFMRSATKHIKAENAAVSWPRYVALDEDRVFNDLDPTWVAEVEDTCSQQGSHCNLVDEVAAGRVNFVPVGNVREPEIATVSYVAPVDDHIEVETVRFVPARDMNVRTVSYVPVDDVDEIATTYIADECPMMVSSVDAGPVYVCDASTILVEEVDDVQVADLRSTQQIAGRFGYRDGFEDGQDAALERDVYHPENSGDYKKATEGYEDEFGNKDVYKGAYRNSYLDGYRAGFESAASV